MFDIISDMLGLPSNFFLSDFIVSLCSTCILIFAVVLFFAMFFRILTSIFT